MVVHSGLRWLLLLLAVLGLSMVGCDSGVGECFAVDASCTQAGSFSAFGHTGASRGVLLSDGETFDADCCEGSCKDETENPNVEILAFCRVAE